VRIARGSQFSVLGSQGAVVDFLQTSRFIGAVWLEESTRAASESVSKATENRELGTENWEPRTGNRELGTENWEPRTMPVDRLSPALEPDRLPLMRQNWHHLLFLHWEIPPRQLQALLPPGLELDTFEGKAYVGLIPFTMTDIRPMLMPSLPGLSSLHEVNVRTYVHQEGRNPGVWFFSLDASSSIAVAAARAAYHLPYFHAEIDFTASNDSLPLLELTSHRDDERGPMPAHGHFRYSPDEGPAAPAAPGTLEHFLVERYLLYSIDGRRQLHRAQVHHQPYPLQQAEVHELDETLVWAADIRRSQDLPLRLYAREVEVKVYGLERC
jgi:uncharacterized protein YqjF (DUF2071 family)